MSPNSDSSKEAPLGQQELAGEFAIEDGDKAPQTGGEHDDNGDGSSDPPQDPPQESQAKNVRLGEGLGALPEGPLNIGMNTVHIPSEEDQRNGFYTENFGILTAQFPQYKTYKALGT